MRHLPDGIRRRLRPDDAVARTFISIDEQLGPYRHLLKGRVLNAGAGDRDISHLVDGELVNQDIPEGLHSANIHILSSLEAIPVEAGHFDVVVCNAVLEHVANPEAVMAEIARVLKPRGVLYLAVPFMQPVHRDPIDCQRYTDEGLRQLCARHGMIASETRVGGSVETTFAWLIQEWLAAETRLSVLVFGRLIYELLARRARRSTRMVPAVASAFLVIATRTAADESVVRTS